MSDATPTICVLTAVGRAEPAYLQELAGNIKELARGVDVEWVLAIDGDQVSESDVRQWTSSAGLERVVVVPAPSDTSTGPGSTRNRALCHVSAPWLATIDADDTFNCPALLELLRAASKRPDLAWAAGRACDVDPQGVWINDGPPDVLQPGITVRGSFLAHRATAGSPPFSPSATIVRTDVVRRIGGWPEGWVRTEDTALWAVIDAWFCGVWVPMTVLNYRKHPESVTHAPTYTGTAPELVKQIVEFVRLGRTNG